MKSVATKLRQRNFRSYRARASSSPEMRKSYTLRAVPSVGQSWPHGVFDNYSSLRGRFSRGKVLKLWVAQQHRAFGSSTACFMPIRNRTPTEHAIYAGNAILRSFYPFAFWVFSSAFTTLWLLPRQCCPLILRCKFWVGTSFATLLSNRRSKISRVTT